MRTTACPGAPGRARAVQGRLISAAPVAVRILRPHGALVLSSQRSVEAYFAQTA